MDQNNSVPDQGNSNLPTSLDITQLLSKLNSIETNSTTNEKKNIQLIELDPHYSEQKKKIRLFLAAVHGARVVVAQLFALELTKVQDGDAEDYEWVDVSVASAKSENCVNEPVVIFPPAAADSLPYFSQNKSDPHTALQAMNNAEITSCALIPSPAIRVTSSGQNAGDGEHDSILTQRSVAVVLGTSRGQVLSTVLRVSNHTNEVANSPFVLWYDECRNLDDKMREKSDSDAAVSKQPVVHQILPRSKFCGVAECLDTFHFDNAFLRGYVDTHVQVIHPSRSAPAKGSMQVTSISFGRGDWESNHNRKKKRGHTVQVNQDIVWVVYGNGALVKLPSWKLFFTLDNDDQRTPGSNYVKGVSEGDSAAGNPTQNASVIPVNNPFPSPLDIPPPELNRLNPSGFSNRDVDFDEQSIASKMSMTSKMSIGTSHSQYTVGNEQNYWNLFLSAVSQQVHGDGHQQLKQSIQALVIGAQPAPGLTLPISVQSSRVECAPPLPSKATDDIEGGDEDGHDNNDKDDHSWASSSEDEQYGPVTGKVVGGTAALVKGALGAALGAVRWGFGAGAGIDDSELIEGGDNENGMNVDDSLDIDEPVDKSHEDDQDRFDVGSKTRPRNPHIEKGEAVDLLPWPLGSTSLLFSDVPRRFDKAVVDPSSSLIATTDNLGRVVLIDLETQQPIRMWKGMRNVSCHYAELPCDTDFAATKSRRSKLYLVIHKRGTLEVYRLRQGPRVFAAAVPQNNCAIVECFGPPSEGSRVTSFLYEEILDTEQNESDGKQCILDYVVIDDADIPAGGSLQKGQQSIPQEENSMQLNFLVQLLATDTNIQCNEQTILATFKSIRGLSDLGEGLDYLSKSHKIDEQLGLEGSIFHSQALSHCKTRLNLALEKETREGSGMLQKSVISSLSSKISYHEKLILAYDVLHRYEVRNDENYRGVSDVDFQDLQTSDWASEAISWISAAEEHDTFTSSRSAIKQKGDFSKPLTFSRFATTCTMPNPKARNATCPAGVYLSEVKKVRQPILMRVFRPLLEDLFVFKVVNSIFSSLGIDQDYDILQQYFGEWVATLASYDIAQSNLSGAWRPMLRWLQDLILCAYDTHQRSPTDFDEVQMKRAVKLQSLLDFCSEMEDLTKAFLLAVICMDAVSSAGKQIEEKTYGKISQLECVHPWEVVLRKLRVLLLVSLRLSEDVNPVGAGINPMTVKTVSKTDQFSTYYWIARDELALSHDNQVLMALESACLSSPVAFYPSSSDGDTTANKKVILQSCSYTKKFSVFNPSGLTNDSHSRPLLFYLRDHATCTTHLAAHRALILGSLWGQSPNNVMILRNAVFTLQVVFDRFKDFSLAVVVEFYQLSIRPTCQAIMFGFHDVHDISKEIMSPLIDDAVWRWEFLSAAKRVLSLIMKCMKKHELDKPPAPASFPKGNSFNITEMWPPLQDDPYLVALAFKFRRIHLTTVQLHHTALFVYELTSNIRALESIIPSVHQLFGAGALFLDMPSVPGGSPQQYRLLDELLVEHAKNTRVPIVDSFDLNSIETVATTMGINVKYVRTRYFLEMFQFGKDASIDALLASNISHLDKSLFLNEIVHILCQRLDATIRSLKKSKSYRGVISILDADTSRWIREEAARGSSLRNDGTPVSLIATNSLVLRIQNMSKSVADESLEKKIAAISMMSSTLLKAVKAQEQQVLDV